MQISEEESRATLFIPSKHLRYQKGWNNFNSSSYHHKEMQIFVWVFSSKLIKLTKKNDKKAIYGTQP